MTLLISRPRMNCPSCATRLDGGPIRYRCENCHRGVSAADTVTEKQAVQTPPVTYRDALRERLPNAWTNVIVAVGSLEVGYLLDSHLGVISG